LEYLRAGLPDHEPYMAWSNFEFLADDGTINGKRSVKPLL
jgi:hypothetical protein